MQIRLFLLSLAIASVFGEQCISDAVYDATTKTCKCKEGQLGNPDLCCYPPSDKKACILSADPVLINIGESKMSYLNPCHAPVAVIEKRNRCKLEVYLAMKELEMGRMYPTRATVTFRPRGQTDNMFIRLNAESNPAIRITMGRRSKNLDFGKEVRITSKGQFVTARHNIRTGMFRVEACGTRVNIRLVSDDKVKQARTPGVCVAAPQDSWSTIPYPCNERQNLSAVSHTTFLSVAMDSLTRFIMDPVSYQEFGHPKYKTVCKEIRNEVNTCGRKLRIRNCVEMVLNTTTRQCLYKKAGGVADTRITRAFKNCIAAMCTTDSSV